MAGPLTRFYRPAVSPCRITSPPTQKLQLENGGFPMMSKSSRQERSQIDTTLPFHSVRDAVNMFGGVDGRTQRLTEKRISREAEIQQAWEELAKVRDQLTHADEAKTEALVELVEAIKILKEIKKNLQDADASKEMVKEAMEVVTVGTDDYKIDQEEEKHVTSEAERKERKKQPMEALAELEIAKRELGNLKHEILHCMEERDSAVRQAEEALAAAGANTKRVEELTAGIFGTNDSLELVKLVCIEANKEKTVLLAAKDMEERIEQSEELEAVNQKQAAANQLELKLATTTDELEGLRKELAIVKEAEGKVARVAAEAVANFEEVKSELEGTRLSEASATSSAAFLSSELQEAKKNLIKSLDDGTSLKTVIESLQDELKLTRKELVDLKDREAIATASAASLTIELTKTKAELAAAAMAEAKANEAITGLTEAFQQVKAETEEAKLEADAMREEACKARADAEQAKAAVNTAESKWQDALREAEAAKAAESIALGRIKVLCEGTIGVRASGMEDARITISQDEYDALQRKIEEAEELASMRVAAALAQVEALRTSEQEFRQRLGTADENIEEMRKATKQAQHKVEMAEAAKSAVEGELRRLREKAQRRRERRLTISETPQPYMTNGDGDQSFSFGTTYVAPLGKVLNMKIPSTEPGHKTKEKANTTQRKKKNRSSSGGGYLVKN